MATIRNHSTCKRISRHEHRQNRFHSFEKLVVWYHSFAMSYENYRSRTLRIIVWRSHQLRTPLNFAFRTTNLTSMVHTHLTIAYRAIPIVHASVTTITLVANVLLLLLLLRQRWAFQKRYVLWLRRTVNGVCIVGWSWSNPPPPCSHLARCTSLTSDDHHTDTTCWRWADFNLIITSRLYKLCGFYSLWHDQPCPNSNTILT